MDIPYSWVRHSASLGDGEGEREHGPLTWVEMIPVKEERGEGGSARKTGDWRPACDWQARSAKACSCVYACLPLGEVRVVYIQVHVGCSKQPESEGG